MYFNEFEPFILIYLTELSGGFRGRAVGILTHTQAGAAGAFRGCKFIHVYTSFSLILYETVQLS